MFSKRLLDLLNVITIYSNLKRKRQTWKLINCVLNYNQSASKINAISVDNNVVKDNSRIFKEFNEYFVNICFCLVKNIPPSEKKFKQYMNTSNQNSMHLSSTDSVV